jgi:hypothetical protein
MKVKKRKVIKRINVSFVSFNNPTKIKIPKIKEAGKINGSIFEKYRKNNLRKKIESKLPKRGNRR